MNFLPSQVMIPRRVVHLILKKNIIHITFLKPKHLKLQMNPLYTYMPVPYACPLIESCNSHFYSFEEYQIHTHEISSSNHSTLEHLVLEGFDSLSIVINQLSHMICDFVKPKDTNISFGFYRCHVAGCHSSRGEFHSLIEHFLEKHIGYVELLNQWGFFYGTLTYNLKEYDNPTNIEFTVPQDFGSGHDPLFIKLNQISNILCQFVKPKVIYTSFGYYCCYIAGCNNTRNQ